MIDEPKPTQDEGVNVIGIKAGSVRLEMEKNKVKQRRSQATDRVVVIGAHYDTVVNTSGLNDNGSGIGVMLEMVRLLENCRTRYSIIFVAFDLEEIVSATASYSVCHRGKLMLFASQGCHW